MQNVSSDNDAPLDTLGGTRQQASISLDPYRIKTMKIQSYLEEQQATNADPQFFLINELQLLNTSTPPVHLYKKLVNTDHQQSNYFCIKNDDYVNDFKLFIETVIAWLQQKSQLQPNNATKHRPHIRIALIGTDQFISQFLHVYIDIFKVQDLISTFKFYYIPYLNGTSMHTSSFMYRFMCGFDQQYASLFGDELWLNLDSLDVKLICDRIKRYVNSQPVSTCVSFQICEAMIITEDSPPQFIPFICDFRIGMLVCLFVFWLTSYFRRDSINYNILKATIPVATMAFCAHPTAWHNSI